MNNTDNSNEEKGEEQLLIEENRKLQKAAQNKKFYEKKLKEDPVWIDKRRRLAREKYYEMKAAWRREQEKLNEDN